MPTTGNDVQSTEVVSSKPKQVLWRNRDYMLLWGGQLISSMGTQVSQFAFPLIVLLISKSPAQAGIAGALRALPYIFFSLPAGALIDRWDRKRVMIVCDTGRALVMASIVMAFALGHLTVIHLCIVAFLEGTLFVFFNIAEVSCLSRVVSKEQLSDANSQNTATEGTTVLIGPSLGGILYSIGYAMPFFVDAISYACSVISLFFIKTDFQGKRVVSSPNLLAEIKEGFAWLWHQPLVRFLAILIGATNLAASGTMITLILLAQRQHATTLEIGLLFSIGGIGFVLGAVIASPVQKKLSFAQIMIGTGWIIALLTPLYIVMPHPLLLGVISAIISIALAIANITQMSYRLSLIPDELQGRVNSVFRLIAFSGQPIGLAITGLLLQTIGPAPVVLVTSACFLLFAIATTLSSSVRNAQKSTIAA